MFHPITSAIELEAALAHSADQPIVLFKHSAWCGVSSMARSRLEDFAANNDAPIYEVVVQQARPVSNAIAERFGIRHETPQVFVVTDGEVLYHASHSQIHPDPLRSALANTTSPTE